MSTIFTIGHSTRTAEEFAGLLENAGVRFLVDVRRYPGSRRYPHFNREKLQEFLGTRGIAYIHAPELGGRRETAADSKNGFWRNASFRAYADHMSSAEFQSAIERVEQIAASIPIAIMCAEAVPWRCHRQLISDALVARGHDVQHILSDRRTDAHEINQAAVVDARGQVTYPAEQGAQSSLFHTDA